MRPQILSVNAEDASLSEARFSRELNVRCKRSVAACREGLHVLHGLNITGTQWLYFGNMVHGRYHMRCKIPCIDVRLFFNDLEVLFFNSYVANRT
jgi:hypothetical protein